MTTSTEEILEHLYGKRVFPKLQNEILSMTSLYLAPLPAMELAASIYKHLRDEVIREADLLNYESYP